MRERYELHLISDDYEASAGNPRNARMLGRYESYNAAMDAGRTYLRQHPGSWLQVCEPTRQGMDVEADRG